VRDRTGAGACAVALLVAVAAAVDPWGFRPYTTLRWAAVAVLVAALAALVPWRPPRGIGLVGAGLLAWLAVATVTALDPLVAVVGHPRRHLGLLGWVVCALAFLAGTGLSTAEVRRWVGRGAVVAVGLTGVGAAADLLGWDPPGGSFGNARVGALLGQPLYLGAVAVLLTPVAVGVALDRSAPVAWRRAAGAAAAGGAAALLGSQTRGAWAGALVAAAVPAPALWRSLGGSRRRLAVGAAAGVLVVLAAAGPLGSRAVAGLDPSAGSLRGRLDEWVVAAAVVVDHPLTGAGPEGYRVAAPEQVDDGYARRYGREEVVDRAHDGVLDVATTGGIPAGLLYAALLAAVLARCVRALRRPPDPVLAGAAAGVVGWAVQQVVGFPIAEVDPVAWLLAGAVVVAAPARRAAPAEPPTGAPAEPEAAPATAMLVRPAQLTYRLRAVVTRVVVGEAATATAPPGLRLAAAGGVPVGTPGPAGERPPAAPGPWGRRPRVALAGGLACVLAAMGALALVADRDLRHAERASARSADAEALAAADRATDRRPDDVDAWYVAAQVAARRPGLLGVDAALDRVEQGRDRSPRDAALRDLHVRLLTDRALRSERPDDLAVAREAAEAAARDDPANPSHHRHLAAVLAAEGEDGRAATARERARELEPLGEPR
jgi:O-antigen ligase